MINDNLFTDKDIDEILKNQELAEDWPKMNDEAVKYRNKWIEALKYKEDAEKWNEAVRNGFIVTEEDATIYRIADLIEVNDELKKIVERLKKRIEELNECLEDDFRKGIDNLEDGLVLDNLQKILDGKNG